MALRKQMKLLTFLVGVLAIAGVARAAELDVLALLKRNLGASVEVISEREIRYCPDNTCTIYRIKDLGKAAYLATFVYLHLFHESDYIYLREAVGPYRPFRETGKDQEPSVRKQAEGFCVEATKSPACVLRGMREALGISVTSGRYDEGKFNES
jgi:hypothetical protein